MEPEVASAPLADFIRHAAAKLRLPPWVGEGAASQSLAMLIGMIVADPSLLEDREITFSRAEVLKYFSVRLYIKENPVAYMLSRELFVDEGAAMDLIAEEGVRSLLQSGLIRSAFAEFISDQLEIARQIIIKNGLQTKKPIRKSVSDRFLECRRLLLAEEYSGDSSLERVASAKADVEKKFADDSENRERKRKTKVFRYRSLKVQRRRQREAWDILYGLGKTQRTVAKRAIARARRVLPDDEEEDPRQPSEKQHEDVSRFCYGKALRAQGRDYPVAIGVPRGIGHAEVCQVINEILPPKCDEDVLIGTMAFGVCSYPQLKEAKVRLGLKTAIIQTKTARLQRAPKAKLYRPTSGMFSRPLPLPLGRDYKAIRRNRKRFAAAWARVEGRLRRISPHVTIANLTHALVTHGESWLGIPSIIAEMGLRTTRKKFPAWRSYVTVDMPLLRRLEKFLRVCDPDFQFPEWWNYPGSGSKLCPQTRNLVRLFRHWQWLMQPLRLRSDAQVIKHWNELAAGLHLLFMLLCGLRNHPMPGPPIELLELTDWDLIHQKLHVSAFYVPRQLRALMLQATPIFAHLWAELKLRGITPEDDHMDDWAYCFLECSKSNKWRCVAPSNQAIVTALAGCRGLRPFADLDRKALRHWSNTVLRECGFSELEVRLFHNHAEFMLHGLRRHRLEPVINRELLQKMADSLFNQLGVKLI